MWETSEPLNRSLSWLTGRFLLRFPCITSARSQIQRKYPFYMAQHFFSLRTAARQCISISSKRSPRFVPAPGRARQADPSPPSAQPWVRNRDQAGKAPASLAPAAPTSETSGQNVPGWELGTSLPLVADLQKTFHRGKTVPSGCSPPRRRPMTASTSTEALGSANGELFPDWGVLASASGNGKFHPESGGSSFH